jgi:hypothetical protein
MAMPPRAWVRQEFNVLDFGALPDAEVLLGFRAGSKGTELATDNLPAFEAAVAAIQATGVPGRLRIPAGTYYLSGRWFVNATVPIEIVGDGGDYFGGNRPTNLVWPRFNFISGAVTKIACLHIATPAGSIIRDINIWQPPADAVLPWSTQKARGGAFTFNTNVIPDEGSFGVTYHCTLPSPGVIPGDTHTPFPKEIDIATRFNVGDLIYVPSIIDSLNPNNKVYRYRVIAATGDQTTDVARNFLPYTGGQAEPFVAGAHYDGSSVVRPTDVNWTGSYFAVVAGSGAVNTEPNWPREMGRTVTQDGVTFKNAGPIWPRSPGLTTTTINTGTLATISWQLDDTSGVFHDTNGGGTPIDWEVQAPIAGILFEAATKIIQVNVEFISGDGVRGIGSTGTPGDAWRAEDIIIQSPANDGFTITGGDANIGTAKGIQVFGAGRAHIWDKSFLGNSYYECHIRAEDGSHPGRFGYRCTELTAATAFYSCYMEGGSAPSYIAGPQSIIAPQGLWSFFHDDFPPAYYQRSRFLSSHFVTSGPPGKVWRAGEVLVNRDIRRPTTSNGKRYIVTTVDTPGVTRTKQSEPAAAFNRITSVNPIDPTDNSRFFREGLVQVKAATGKDVSPIELTFAKNHGFTTGQSNVVVGGVGGNTAANGTWTVTVTANDKITLNGSTGNGDYTDGGTATDNGTNWIEYQCLGTESSRLALGNDDHPDFLLEINASDIKDQFGVLARLVLLANAPTDGQLGLVTGGIPGNCIMGFDTIKVIPIFPQPIRVGPSAGRLWSWSFSDNKPAAEVLPKTENLVGDIVWNLGNGFVPPSSGYVGWYCTAAGDPGSWTKFGKLYDATQEAFDQPRMRWAGGTDGGGGNLPASDKVRSRLRRAARSTLRSSRSWQSVQTCPGTSPPSFSRGTG